ncbi:MAG: RelA/SpoT family protein [Patescibacteria group bacterium]|nr:RelA/SpoT family protein [Patescibacteria group bacterium]
MLLKNLIKENPAGLIARAYAFAERAHRGQKRMSGEPYFNHPIAVAEILAGWRMDDATIAAGLLHDTVEDTSASIEELKNAFGEETAFLVDGVTKLGRVKYRGPAVAAGSAEVAASATKAGKAMAGTEGKIESMRKLILALSQDLRVVFVKLADRLHNMETLAALPPAKQRRIALETDEIYAPLAYRLGMHNLSGELQDLAFPFLYPKEYRWILESTKAQYEKRIAYLEKLKPEVEALLEKHGLKPLTTDFRAKRYGSLYKKMLRYGMDIGKIYDLVAMRLIVQTIPECYAVLGVIHEAWPPLPGRIKDYIAMPKPNGYRSLHTTVIGPDEKIVEFQIRTAEMHEENEYGVAAHWLYKQKQGTGNREQGKNLAGQKLAKELAWVQQLKHWQEHVGNEAAIADPEEFMRAMKIDFFKDRIFAITPHGDVIDLPAGSTPVDFAYHVHSEVGDAATGAKVNGALVPLDHVLQSGDMVEILTQKGKKPSEAWLQFVKSGIARDRIRISMRQKRQLANRKPAANRCELKIAVEDRVGLIKDLSATIARNHLNIVAFHSDNPKDSRYPFDKIEIQCAEKEKIEKLILKLKAVKGVKEISYRLI